ncbi:MAG TPA: flavodoxin family protein [Clostridiaceae bacterium]|nr:flavodoxin family protein [Clostridiaceae bacterium]
MKKIVVLTGSPREKGNTNRLAEAFMKAAVENKMEVARIDTLKLKVNPCLDCRNCYSEQEKACFYEDDFNEVAKEISAADGIVFVSPVYWYTFSAPLKLVLDKFVSFSTAKKDFSQKRAALISCAGDKDQGAFTGLLATYAMTVRHLNMISVGELLLPAVYKVGDIDNTDGFEQAALLAENFL